MNTAGVKEMVMQQCIDEITDAAMLQAGADIGACKTDFKRTGSRLEMRQECQSNAGRSTTLGFFEGDFDSAYHGETKHNDQLTGADSASRTVAIRATWVGDCKPDMKPGDYSIPGVAGYINMLDRMRSLAPKR